MNDWCNGVTPGLQLLVCRNPSTAYDLTFNEFRSTGWGAPDWPTLAGTYTLAPTGPTVSTVSAASANEGSPVVQTITLSGPTVGVTNFAASLAGSGTYPAVNGVNFSTNLALCTYSNGVTFSAGNLVFPDAVTSCTISTPTTSDSKYNHDLTFTTTVGGTPGVGTIVNTTTAPTLSINDPTTTAGVPETFTITQSAVSALDTTVLFSTGNITALAGVDYTARTGVSCTIPAGSLTTTVDVTTL
jgi:hypothetical protein